MPAKPRNRSPETSLTEQTIRFADEAAGAHNDVDGHKKNLMWRMLHAGGSPKPQQGHYSPPQKYSKEVFVARPILKGARTEAAEPPMHSSFDISPVEEESRFAKASPGRLMDWAREISPADQSEGYLRKISHWRSHSRSQSNSDKSHKRKDSHLRGHSQTSVSTLSSHGPSRSPYHPPPPPPPEKDLKWRERSKPPVIPMPSSARSPLSPRFFQKMSFGSNYSSSSGSSGIHMPPPPQRPQRPPTTIENSIAMERSTSDSSSGSQWQFVESNRNSERSANGAHLGQSLTISTKQRSPPPHKSPRTPQTPRTPRSPVITKGKIRTRSRSGRNMSSRRGTKHRERAEEPANKKWSKIEADLRRKKGLGMSLTEDDVARYKARGLPPLPYNPPGKKNDSISDWVDEIANMPNRSPDFVGSPVLKEVPRYTQQSAISTPTTTRDPSIRVNRRGRRKSIPSVIDDFRMQSIMPPPEDQEDILNWLESFRPEAKSGRGSSKSSRRKPVAAAKAKIVVASSSSSSMPSSEKDASSSYSNSGSSSPSSDNDRFPQPATPPSYEAEQQIMSAESSDADASTALHSATTRSNKQRRHFSIRIPSMAELPGHELAKLSGLLPPVVMEEEEPMSPNYIPPNVDLSLLSPPACVSAFTPSSTRSPHIRDGRSSTASSAGDAFMYDQLTIVHPITIQTNATARTAITNAMNKKEESLRDKRALLKLSAFGRSPIAFSPSLFGDLNSGKTMVDLSLGGFESPRSQAPKSALFAQNDLTPQTIIISNDDFPGELEAQTPVEFLTDAVYSRPTAQTIELAQVDSPKSVANVWLNYESDNESEDSGEHCYDSSWEYPSSDESSESNSSNLLKEQIEALIRANSTRSSEAGEEGEARSGIVRLSTAELRILAGRNSQFPGDILFGIMQEDMV